MNRILFNPKRLPDYALGIARARQAQRIREHPVLSRGFVTPPASFSLGLAGADVEKYWLIHTERVDLTPTRPAIAREDISHLRDRREFSALTLVAEVARYLNKPCLEVEDLLARMAEGIAGILAHINAFNELLYDHIIPRLFEVIFEVEAFEKQETYAPSHSAYATSPCQYGPSIAAG